MHSTNIDTKYWSFLDNFNDCTLHFFWNSLFTKHLHYNWQEKCFRTGGNCILLHTTYTDSYFISKTMITNNKNLLGYLNLTKVYTKLLNTTKYHANCIVHIAGMSKHITQLGLFHRIYEISIDFINYIVVPVRLPINFPTSVVLEIPICVTAKIYMLNWEKFEIYTDCPTCKPIEFSLVHIVHNWKRVKAIKLLFMVSVISSIHSFSGNKLYSGKSNKCLLNCPYETLKNNSKVTKFLIVYVGFRKCVNQFINYHFNLSEDTTPIKIIPYLTQTLFINKKVSVIPSVTEYYGLKYSIFSAKQSSKWSQMGLTRLLSPFEWYGWILFIVSVLLIAKVLQVTGVIKLQYHWLYATLFEQDVNIYTWRNKKNAFVITSWLFTAIILRNGYTSSMYTYMTMDSGPSYVPKSFKEIILNTTTSFLLDFTTTFYMNELFNFFVRKKKTNSSEYKHLKQIVESRAVVVENLTYLVDMFLDSKYQDLIYCLDKFSLTWPIVKESFMLDNFTKPPCIRQNQFYFLYNIGQHSFDDYLLIMKLQIFLLNRNYLHENSEPALFSRHLAWVILEKSVLENSLKIAFSSFVEGGLYGFQFRYFKQMSLLFYLNDEIQKNRKTQIWGNTSETVTRKAFSKWIKYNCFETYKFTCSLANVIETTGNGEVHAIDLIVVWGLYVSLILICCMICFLEVFYTNVGNYIRMIKHTNLSIRLPNNITNK